MAESVGTQLRQAREARKLSLEQVYQTTRISTRYLQGLENDQPQALPSAVQGKGFLRLYASFLNLPVQPLLDQWEGKPPVEPAPEEETAGDAPEEIPSEIVVIPEQNPETVEENIEVAVIPVVEEDTESAADEPAPAELPLSQQIFNEIGVALRDRRQSLGLTIEDVERFTKLRRHYLTALEAGRTGDLPSLVQGRGMLGNYAHFLELDVDALLLRFADALQQRRTEMMPPPPEPGLISKRRPAQPASANAATWRRLFTPDLFIGGVIIIAIIGFAIWGAAQVSALRQKLAAPTALPIAEILVQTTTVTPEATLLAVIPPTLAPNRELGNLPSGQESVETTPTSIPVIDDSPLQIYVVARKRAWLRVIVDSKIAFNGRIIPGNAYPFAGDRQIELITGDASSLQIFFNQTDLGNLGNNAEAKTLIFEAAGVVTPTPSFSATPTRTTQPTITPQPTATQSTPTITPFIP